MKTDREVRKLMDELNNGQGIEAAARAAAMCDNTARRYRDAGQLPSEMKPPNRSWRTRKDPFHPDDWAWVVSRLRSPVGNKLQAKALFEAMRTRDDAVVHYADGGLRSFQRKVRRWRAQHGPEKEIFFPQEHRPGEALQTDWLCGKRFLVTLADEIFEHKLVHTTLPCSNWRSVRVCRSESLSSLKDGVQAALRKLGRRAEWHQTDQSSAATHQKGTGRTFNVDYASFVDHHGMKPRTIAVRKPEQNGDVESGNGAVAAAVEQALLLRDSRDFADWNAYQAFIDQVVEQMNRGKQDKLRGELEHMEPVTSAWAPTFKELQARVGKQSTLRILENTYSVPSRLIGERVKVRVYDMNIEVWHAEAHQFTTERLVGRSRSRIDYRHIIWSMRRKPGAFRRYRYREELFPRPIFRRCYDALPESGDSGRRDTAYLDILHLAASTSEDDVATALELLLDEGRRPSRDAVLELTTAQHHVVPSLKPYDANLKAYDDLLTGAIQ